LLLQTVNDTVMSMQSRKSIPIRLEDRFRKLSSADEHKVPKVQRSMSEVSEPSSTGMRRRRFTLKASHMLRKSVSGPDYEETEQHLSAKHIRKILAKNSVTNVSMYNYIKIIQYLDFKILVL